MPGFVIEFLLLVIFFVAFKMYDIYIATITIMVGATLQVIFTRIFSGKYEKKQLIILAMLYVFGGMTVYFHDPIFIKWKPTFVFGILGLVVFFSNFIGKKPMMQRVIEHAFADNKNAEVPLNVWKKLNMAWAIFFIVLGTSNVFVAYYFSTNTWVHFKLYGVLSALIIFSLAQSIFLSKYLSLEGGQK